MMKIKRNIKYKRGQTLSRVIARGGGGGDVSIRDCHDFCSGDLSSSSCYDHVNFGCFIRP